MCSTVEWHGLQQDCRKSERGVLRAGLCTRGRDGTHGHPRQSTLRASRPPSTRGKRDPGGDAVVTTPSPLLATRSCRLRRPAHWHSGSMGQVAVTNELPTLVFNFRPKGFLPISIDDGVIITPKDPLVFDPNAPSLITFPALASHPHMPLESAGACSSHFSCSTPFPGFPRSDEAKVCRAFRRLRRTRETSSNAAAQGFQHVNLDSELAHLHSGAVNFSLDG